MIEAKDLRIGNWINWITPDPKPTYEQVNQIDEDSINECFPEEYEGIPLTQEVLQKCRFTKDTFSWFGGWLSPMVNDESIRVLEKDGDWQWNNNGRPIQITSLHQLQNLYFVLTGTELTYTP
jgi:hypothetical protein